MLKKIKSKLWGFGTFYYSKKHDQMKQQWNEEHYNYFIPLFGKTPRQYNSWVSRFPFISPTKWEDEKFVGFGFYHHSERK